MARDVNVKLRLPGLNKLMRSPGVQQRVNASAARIAAAAGPGHRVVVYPHRWVARAFVEQDSDEQARKDPNGERLLGALSQQIE